MSRLTAAASCSRSVRKIARATASRGASSSTKRSPWASCSVAPSPRIASVIRKPSRPGDADHRGRVELGELEVGERGAGRAGEQQAGAERAGRVGGARPQRGGAAGGEDRAARGAACGRPRAARRCTRPSAVSRRAARAPSSTSIAGCSATSAESWRRIRRPVALPPACTTRRTPWPPSRPSARLPWRSASKRTPSASRSWKRAGASSHRTSAALRRTRPRPAVERVLRGGARASRRPPARPPGRPAPSRTRSRRAGGRRRAPPGRPRGRRTGRRTARPRPRPPPRGRSARRSRKAVRYRRARALAAPRRLARPRHPRASRAARADPRARGGDGAPRLVRRDAARGAGGRPRAAAAGPSGAVRGAIEELCARGGGFIDADTAAVPATLEAALRAAGGAAALVDALLGGSARGRRVGAAAARATTPSRSARWGSASSATWRWRRGGRRRAHGLERVLILDWDVHHGNGTEAIFARRPDVLFVSIHEWPLYPGTGPASYVGVGPGEGYTVNLPVRAGSGDAAYRSLVEHVAAPLIARVGAAARARLRGLRRAPRRPAGHLHGHRGGLRRHDRVAAAGVPTRSARRSGWCSRAATTSARWPARWRR